MAEAKITIKTLVDNQELQKLNKDLAEGTQELKRMQKQYKEWEKAGTHSAAEMAKLNTQISAQRAINAKASKDIRNLANELTNAGKASKGLSDFAKQFGYDIDGILGKLTSTTGILTGLAAATIAVGSALVSSARDVSSFSNQFINFAGSAKEAEKMYDLFNETYRNTNYDEQKVYDMAKALMRIGVSADDSASLIMKCADAAASLGEGQEYAAQLADSLAKVKVGGELSQKQLVELAKAGIDLTDVQDDIKAGGERAYNALIDKLDQFKGGMQKAKGTAAEMEGDIKGNLVEIGRQAALLIDDFFGFSEMLRGFYQWVIEVSQSVIDKLKSMRTALAENLAAADAYSAAMQGVEEPGLGASQEEIKAYGEKVRLAHEAAEQAKEDARAHEEALATMEKTLPVVQAITKATSSGGGGGGGRSSSSGSAKAVKEEDPFEKMMKEHQQEMANIQAELDFKLACRAVDQETYEAMMETRRNMNNEWVQEQLESEALTLEQKVALWKQYIAKKQDVQKDDNNKVRQWWDGQAQAFASSMADCIVNAKSFGEAFSSIIKNIIAQLIQAAIYATIVSSFMPGGIAGKGNFSGLFKKSMGFATGGYISGAGTSTSDSIPARLSNGEYVLNAEAVQAIGVDKLNRVNFGTHNYAEGGAVGIGNNITLNVQAMDASGFGDFLARGGFDSIKQAFTNDDRLLGATAGTW